ncbi:MAG: hypothetical protein ACYC26_14185 [Phycisphaerales bacterium]
MSVASFVAGIADGEQLARFVMVRRWIREDESVKADAFIPPDDLQLSVTRHASLTVDEIWTRGRHVADIRHQTLHGRADINTQGVRGMGLDVVAHAVEGNPQHAHVVGWPPEKAARKSKAQELAAIATYTKLIES